MSAAKKKKKVAKKKTKAKSVPKKKVGKERRRFERRPIMETFSLSAVIDSKGGHRLPIHDLSEVGIGFDYDTLGELTGEFPVKEGDRLELRVFLNRSLSIPLTIKVMRVQDFDGVRRIGGELTNKKSGGVKALNSFLRMLDEIQPNVDIVA